jgi:hypothetical protein
MKTYFYSLSFFLSTLFLTSCDKMAGCKETEIIRKGSPDSKVDFLIIEKDCGATTSKVSKVYITPSGQKATGEPIFVSDKAEGLHVHWEKPKSLTIEYADARIHNFQNFWSSREVDSFGYEVRIVEKNK